MNGESNAPIEPELHQLVSYVKEFGASAAARYFAMGYSVVRRKARGAGLRLRRGRRANKALAARNAEIRVMRMQGLYLMEIGTHFKLGRERVRQILEATGGDPLKRSDPVDGSPAQANSLDSSAAQSIPTSPSAPVGQMGQASLPVLPLTETGA